MGVVDALEVVHVRQQQAQGQQRRLLAQGVDELLRVGAVEQTGQGIGARVQGRHAGSGGLSAGSGHQCLEDDLAHEADSQPSFFGRLAPHLRPRPMHSAAIEAFFATLQAANPRPQTELEYTSVFELLAAVLLSAQATDAGVNKATRRLFALAPNPQALVALGEEGVSELVRTIGLFRTKAKNLVQTCRQLLRDHGGQVPRSRAALEALPGVGRKTANVVLNVAFGEPTMAVDTHIFRVANRTGLAPGRNPLQVELQLLRRVPAAYRVDAHHWLILHGRYVCTARAPRCGECMVRAHCDTGRRQMRDVSPPAAAARAKSEPTIAGSERR